MRVTGMIVGLLVGTVIGGFSNCRADEVKSEGPKDVVAVIDSVAITQSDLEHRQSAKLLKARDQYFVAERDALNQLIDDTLLEAQARKEGGIGVDQLLELRVYSLVQDPTEDQLRVYYEGLQTDTPYTEARPKILETIHTLRTNKARAEYIDTLRLAADVQLMLLPPTADVALGDAPTRGPRDAAVTIIEFADYECPYCQKIHPELKQLEAEFHGQVLFAFKDYPLVMHKRAEKAAEAARCAGSQGKFWEYHDALFESRSGLEVSQLKEDARTVGLDGAAFDACLDSGDRAAAVQQDQQEGTKLGLSGTPTVFVNKHVFSGATSYAILRQAVAEQIALAPAAPKTVDPATPTHAKNMDIQTPQFPSLIRAPRERAASAAGGTMPPRAAQ